MMVLVSYDVSTTSASGRKRLRRLAKACRDYGQRVQYSVFEIEVDYAQWTFLKNNLYELIDPEQDSLRSTIVEALQAEDSRLTMHDFRLVRGAGHTNLIFDMALPADLMGKHKAIKAKLDADLQNLNEGTYYTVVTFDLATFN